MELVELPFRNRHAARQGTERRTIRWAIGRRQGGEQATVKRPSQRDDLVLCRTANRARPSPHALEGTLVRLCAGVAEEDPICEGQFDQPFCQHFAGRGPEQIGDVDQTIRRLFDGVTQSGVAVA